MAQRQRLVLMSGAALVIVAISVIALAKPGQGSATYYYVRTEESWLVYGQMRFAYLQRQVRETWAASDGTGRVKVAFGSASFFGPNAESEWMDEYGRPTDVDTALPAQSEALPSDFSDADFDRAVAERVSESGLSSSTEVLRLARTLLAAPRVAPGTRSMVLRTLNSETDILRECWTETEGRLTRFVVIDGAPLIRYSLVIDYNGFLVAEDQTLLVRYDAIDAEPPVSIQHVEYVARGLVSSLDERPDRSRNPPTSTCSP